MLSLQELYKQFVDQSDSTNEAVAKFILAAKRQNPDVKMSECMQITGFTSEDDKENINLSQKFRLNILNPTRNYITKKMFNLTDSEVEQLWSRSNENKTEEHNNMQRAVLAKFPNKTRKAKAKTMDFLDEFIF